VAELPLNVADATDLPLAVPDVVQKVIRVLREPGVALGMSVAGGIGAPPDTHDEVRDIMLKLHCEPKKHTKMHFGT